MEQKLIFMFIVYVASENKKINNKNYNLDCRILQARISKTHHSSHKLSHITQHTTPLHIKL